MTERIDPQPLPAPAAQAPAPPVLVLPRGGPLPALWRLLQPVLAMLVLLAVVGSAVGGAAVWLLRSADGTAWLLPRLPGLQVSGVQGALLSDRFSIDQVVVRWDGNQQSVTIDGLRAEGLRWSWHPSPGAWVGLDARQLRARRVDVQTGPPSARPMLMPRTMQVPLRLQVAQAAVDEVQIDALPPMHGVSGRLIRLWEPGGREYHADALSFDWDRAHIDGTVSLGAQAPYTLQVQARLRSREGTPPWTAELQARGPLAGFDLQATLRGRAPRGAAAPALDIEATIRALEAWPIGSLRLRTQALDLSTLFSQAPSTRLSGRMDIDSRSFTGPVAASVDLHNSQPGRWNEGRVPVRRMLARLRSPDQDRSQLLIEDLDLLLADASHDAGRWHGRGRWSGSRLQIDSQVERLRPQWLDGRAAVMDLSGAAAFTLSGLPSPDPGAATPAGPRPLALELRTTLEGQIEGSPHRVSVTIDGSADARRVELREFRAEAGAAHAVLALNARRRDGQAWQLSSSGRLNDFDPVPWWPGPELAAWRGGQHRLSGSWALDLTLPQVHAGLAPWTLAHGLVGSGTLNVERSLLAGVPLALRLQLGHRPGTDAAPSSINGELVLGANRLVVAGQGNPLGDGRADVLVLDLQADALASLAPLARLWPAMAAWAPRAGQAQAQLRIDGRWPDIRSEGKATLQGLQVGTLEARQAQAGWRFDTASDQPLLLLAEAQGLAQGRQRLEQLRAGLRGTWRQHQLDLSVALPVRPPPGLEAALGLRAGSGAGTLATLRADGQWTADGSGGGRWAGRAANLSVGPWSGSGTSAAAGAGSPWLDARELQVEARYDARQGLTDVQAAAGRLRLADTATLRWDEVRVDLRSTAPAFALRADIEPFALAPLLARGQPGMGWAGDLRLRARVDLQVAEKVDADLVFERLDGDLRLIDETGSLAFGLSELRLVASAHDGHWQLAGGFAGSTLGEAAARLNLRPRPDQRWPSADTPIDGVIEGHVANLGVWGNWVPPGWRLSGDLRTSASVSGRVGAPDYAGEVRASQVAVRNLLLGVDVRQGEALVRLQGARAEIDHFTLRGGDGLMRVRGQANLAGRPSATLQLEAERFRVLGRVDRQLTASGNLNLGLGAEQLRVDGRVRVDEGLFDLSRADAPTLDDDVTIRQARPGPSDAADAAATPRPRRNPQVAVDLDLGDRLKVRGRGLDTTLGGNLRLSSAGGRLAVHGIVSAAGGTYAAYGQKLEIERGLMIFSGEAENPMLDVLALRPDIDLQVGVAIAGPMQTPRVRLYASADMSDSDKLSWLVLGRASEGLGRADTALLQRAAVALLAGEGEAPTDTLLRNLGLDQLSLRQSDTDVRETVISLGKQLSRRWYVGYERGVNATAGTFQLIYRIAQRFTLRAQSGLENSLDLIWVWRLEDKPPEPVPTPVPKSSAAAPP
jgi:translocation and assembly module TamB